MDGHPSKAEILAALSLALDLVEGQPEGHAVRTCAIALKLASLIGFNDLERQDVYYAAILKDSGCSNNSVRIQKIFGGDEFISKRAVKTIDWTSPLASIKFAFEHTERGNGWGAKLRRMAANIGPPNAVMNEVTLARCTRGAMIARKLGFGETVAEAIHQLDEHWDGKGSPHGIKGRDLNPVGQLICLAQTAEVFAVTYGIPATMEMVRERSGRWFDPELARAFLSLEEDTAFWNAFGAAHYRGIVPPGLRDAAAEADIDAICEAFAMIVDAKSSFTAEHSARVAGYAAGIGSQMGLGNDRMSLLTRAGLLHDIGKLAVSTAILEKPGKLDEAEFAAVQSHPMHSFVILQRIAGFDSIAEIASGHHERLDGKGYWQGLGADHLPLETRIMTVADVYDALSAKRPYREALPYEKCRAIMDADAGTAFDPECLEALWQSLESVPLAA